MTAAIDAFTSATLKHLRETWWNDGFTAFLAETLRPRPGNRILDVGCGEGLAEVSIGRLQISQIRLVGIDLAPSKVAAAQRETRSHNQRVRFAAADACRLPFIDAAFDSLYCVAVLQHISDVEAAVSEFARVTARHGRVVAVEPDNTARYLFSGAAVGQHAFELSKRFFAAVASARGEAPAHAVGPQLPALFAKYQIEPLDVRLFPVAHTRVSTPAPAEWHERRAVVERELQHVSSPEARDLGRQLLVALATYEADAAAAGSGFVEIQNTMLFATVGQKT